MSERRTPPGRRRASRSSVSSYEVSVSRRRPFREEARYDESWRSDGPFEEHGVDALDRGSLWDDATSRESVPTRANLPTRAAEGRTHGSSDALVLLPRPSCALLLPPWSPALSAFFYPAPALTPAVSAFWPFRPLRSSVAPFISLLSSRPSRPRSLHARSSPRALRTRRRWTPATPRGGPRPGAPWGLRRKCHATRVTSRALHPHIPTAWASSRESLGTL